MRIGRLQIRWLKKGEMVKIFQEAVERDRAAFEGRIFIPIDLRRSQAPSKPRPFSITGLNGDAGWKGE